MLALFLLPALLGIGLIIGLTDDDDEGDQGANPDDLNTIDQPDGTDILEGTDQADRLVGNDIGSEMLGYGGNDIVLGNGGGDAIDGGAGNDTIYGGAGNDFAVGGQGDDRVFLGDGNDEYLPGERDYDAGDDFVRGGAGADLIGDLLGSNALYGDVGNDTLVAFDGLSENGIYTDPNEIGTTDTLSGGFGNDVVAGDFGDILSGGQGADTFITLDDEDPPLEAVTITDFNPDEDELVIATLFGLAEQDAIGLTYDSQLDAVRASYEGRTVAVLQGLGQGDIAGINVSVTPFNAL